VTSSPKAPEGAGIPHEMSRADKPTLDDLVDHWPGPNGSVARAELAALRSEVAALRGERDAARALLIDAEKFIGAVRLADVADHYARLDLLPRVRLALQRAEEASGT